MPHKRDTSRKVNAYYLPPRKSQSSFGRPPSSVREASDTTDPHDDHNFNIEAGALALCVYRDPGAEQHPHTTPCKASIAMFKEALSAARGEA